MGGRDDSKFAAGLIYSVLSPLYAGAFFTRYAAGCLRLQFESLQPPLLAKGFGEIEEAGVFLAHYGNLRPSPLLYPVRSQRNLRPDSSIS